MSVLDHPKPKLRSPPAALLRVTTSGICGSDLHMYDGRTPLEEGTVRLGERTPATWPAHARSAANGALRVFTLLHKAGPVFLNFGEPGRFDMTPWANRVQSIEATYGGKWKLPAIGTVPAPCGVLIRPDGYVAWVGEATYEGLAEALTTWFGPPSAGCERRGYAVGIARLHPELPQSLEAY